MHKNTKKLVGSALFLALGMLLPTLFHMAGLGQGSVFLPMHIPVLLCGFLCGKGYGALIGILTPLITGVITGMPPFYPIGLAMAAELCTYGFLSGICYEKIKKIYPSLIIAMMIGRIISGITNMILLSFAGKPYTLEVFISTSFIIALPGIMIQLILIPMLVKAAEKTLMHKGEFQ